LTLIKTPAKEEAGTRESRSAKNIQRDLRSKSINVLLQLIHPCASSIHVAPLTGIVVLVQFSTLQCKSTAQGGEK
jgi:hypothetical protein